MATLRIPPTSPVGQLFFGHNFRVCFSHSRSQGDHTGSQAGCGGGCEGAARQQPLPPPQPFNPKGCCFLLLRGQRELWAPPGAAPAVTLRRASARIGTAYTVTNKMLYQRIKPQPAQCYGVGVLLLIIQEIQCLIKGGRSRSFSHRTYTRVCKDLLYCPLSACCPGLTLHTGFGTDRLPPRAACAALPPITLRIWRCFPGAAARRGGRLDCGQAAAPVPAAGGPGRGSGRATRAAAEADTRRPFVSRQPPPIPAVCCRCARPAFFGPSRAGRKLRGGVPGPAGASRTRGAAAAPPPWGRRAGEGRALSGAAGACGAGPGRAGPPRAQPACAERGGAAGTPAGCARGRGRAGARPRSARPAPPRPAPPEAMSPPGVTAGDEGMGTGRAGKGGEPGQPPLPVAGQRGCRAAPASALSCSSSRSGRLPSGRKALPAGSRQASPPEGCAVGVGSSLCTEASAVLEERCPATCPCPPLPPPHSPILSSQHEEFLVQCYLDLFQVCSYIGSWEQERITWKCWITSQVQGWWDNQGIEETLNWGA